MIIRFSRPHQGWEQILLPALQTQQKKQVLITFSPFKMYGTGSQKVIMIMGLSASHQGWEYLLPFLAHNRSNYQVAVFDNRGIGNSLCPEASEQYSMEIFAADTIKLADHLGWSMFHLVSVSTIDC